MGCSPGRSPVRPEVVMLSGPGKSFFMRKGESRCGGKTPAKTGISSRPKAWGDYERFSPKFGPPDYDPPAITRKQFRAKWARIRLGLGGPTGTGQHTFGGDRPVPVNTRARGLGCGPRLATGFFIRFGEIGKCSAAVLAPKKSIFLAQSRMSAETFSSPLLFNPNFHNRGGPCCRLMALGGWDQKRNRYCTTTETGKGPRSLRFREINPRKPV